MHALFRSVLPCCCHCRKQLMESTVVLHERQQRQEAAGVCVFTSKPLHKIVCFFFCGCKHIVTCMCVLLYVFMRMYSVLDCRRGEEENVLSVSYLSNGSLLHPTHTHNDTHAHTSAAPFHT